MRIDDGTSVPLSSFWAKRPVAFVFLRHFGCIFCREHVAKLREHPELNVVFVGLGEPENASVFKETMRTKSVIICDPNKELYAEAGLRPGSLGQMLNPHVLVRGFQAGREGFRNSRPTSDPTMLGGTFVVNRRGEVTHEQRAKDAADNSTPDQIAEWLRLAAN